MTAPYWPAGPKFDPTLPVKVGLVGFVTGGVEFKPGQAFPWKALGMTERRVRLLVEQKRLVQPKAADVVEFSATPGERVEATPPGPQPAPPVAAVRQQQRAAGRK